MTSVLPKRLTGSRLFAVVEAMTTPHHVDRYLDMSYETDQERREETYAKLQRESAAIKD